MVQIDCQACLDAKRPDYRWSLTMSGRRPDSAELDDGPYLSVRPQMIEEPVPGRGLVGGHRNAIAVIHKWPVSVGIRATVNGPARWTSS